MRLARRVVREAALKLVLFGVVFGLVLLLLVASFPWQEIGEKRINLLPIAGEYSWKDSFSTLGFLSPKFTRSQEAEFLAYAEGKNVLVTMPADFSGLVSYGVVSEDNLLVTYKTQTVMTHPFYVYGPEEPSIEGNTLIRTTHRSWLAVSIVFAVYLGVLFAAFLCFFKDVIFPRRRPEFKLV